MYKFQQLFSLSASNYILVFTKLFCALTVLQLVINFNTQYRYFKTNPTVIYGKAIMLLGFFQLPKLSKQQFVLSGVTLIISLIFCFFGVFPRLFILVAFICYFIYFTSIISMAQVQRKTNILPFVFLVLLVSPSLNKTFDTPATTWELVLIKIAIIQIYLSAGIQKLKVSGLKWCNGESLQAYLMENYLWSDQKSAYHLAKHKVVCSVLSTLTLLFELTFVLVIIFPSLSYFYLIFALCFHLGTMFTMRINYLRYINPVYAVFFVDIVVDVIKKVSNHATSFF